MPSVGAVEFDFLKGAAILPPADEVSAEERPGVSGVRYHVVGSRPTAAILRGHRDHADVAAAHAWITSLRALQTTTVTVEDEHGVDHDDCIVKSVRAGQPRAIIDPQVGTSLRFRVEAEVEVEQMQ